MSGTVYDSVLFTVMADCRGAGSVVPYFKERARTFGIFTYADFRADPSRAPECAFERFEGGVSAARHAWHMPARLPRLLKFAFLYCCHAYAALFLMPRRTWIIVEYPLLCVGRTLLRAVKGSRMAYWVWDFYEDAYPAYSVFADAAVRDLEHVLFISRPMEQAYARRVPVGAGAPVRQVLPLGVRSLDVRRAPADGALGYIGNLREGNGLGTVFRALAADPTLTLDVIGTGIALPQLRADAAAAGVADRVRFLGRVDDPDLLSSTIARWQMGVAPYDDQPLVRYADPGKIKQYLEYGLPIVTTDLTPAKEDLERERAGEVARTGSAEDFARAIHAVRCDPASYEAGVGRLRAKYEYHRLYDDAFSFMRAERRG